MGLLKAPFQPFFTLEEAEALQLGASSDGGADGATCRKKMPLRWRHYGGLLSSVGLAETLV